MQKPLNCNTMTAPQSSRILSAIKFRAAHFHRQIRLINQGQVESTPSEDVLPPKARVVICGGGVQGAAVAHELAKLGLGKETVLLEQGRSVEFFIIVNKNNNT